MKKLIESLSPMERKILPHLEEKNLSEICKKSNLDKVSAVRALEYLKNKKIIKTYTKKKIIVEIGVNGALYKKKGLPEKLGRVLKPSGFGAMIHSPMQPPEIMLYTQALGNVSDKEAYKTWSMGQGMVIITPDLLGVQRIAKDHGIPSQAIGEVTKEPGIRIRNRGALNPWTNPKRDGLMYEKGPEVLVFD